LGSLLFKLDDVPADLPTGLHLDRIDRAQHFLPRLANQFAQFAQQ
jgi:hypothetical protein